MTASASPSPAIALPPGRMGRFGVMRLWRLWRLLRLLGVSGLLASAGLAVAQTAPRSAQASLPALHAEGSLRFNRQALVADTRPSPLFRLRAGHFFQPVRPTPVAPPAAAVASSRRPADDAPSGAWSLARATELRAGWDVVADVGLASSRSKPADGPAAAAQAPSPLEEDRRPARDRLASGLSPQLTVGATYRYY